MVVSMADSLRVVQEQTSPRTGRHYKLAETPFGKILFFNIGTTVQYRNLSNHDLMWSFMPEQDFTDIFAHEPVEELQSERIRGFPRKKIKIQCGDGNYYHLAEKSKPDGYLYEIPASDLRAFPAKRFPKMKFWYARYKIKAVQEMDFSTLERIKTREVIRVNHGFKHSVHTVNEICSGVYRYCQEKRK